jgi:PAS domain S-box-containing protein
VSRAIEWILLGTGSCVAIIVGLRLHRPARVGPWLLLAGSVTSFMIGDIFYALQQWSASEAFYLGVFVLIAGALMQFTRGGSLLGDRARLIDLTATACSTLLVVWVFVIGGRGQLGKISAADVIGDLLLVGVAVRLNLAAGKNVSALLLLIGSVGLLLSDIFFPLVSGPLSETGYVVLYTTWGLAALHPSMVRLTDPMPPRPTPWRGHWAVLLGAAVATPPIVLLIEALTATVQDGVVIAVASAITLMLTITRLADAVTLNSQALAREQGLREASADLVSAADAPAVDEAVRAAVAHLVPRQTITEVVFATDDRQMAVRAFPSATAGLSLRSWWIEAPAPAPAKATAEPFAPTPRPWWQRRTATTRFRTAFGRPAKAAQQSPDAAEHSPPPDPGVTGSEASSTHAAGSSTGPTSAASSSTGPPGGTSSSTGATGLGQSSTGVAGSGRSGAGGWRGWGGCGGADGSSLEATLVCPLRLEPLAVARPNGGALVLTGRREVLTMARDALEVLAGQAALALDRISLVEAVGRRDSDLYLRAVIRNTADLMLVIDEDRRIRYASPAVHELLGVPDLSPLATLEDLVHGDDRGQVRRAFAADGDGTFFCALHRADNSQILIEATYRDLREDRLVQGFVVTMRDVTAAQDPVDQLPHQAHMDELPAWLNRRSAQHKFRY